MKRHINALLIILLAVLTAHSRDAAQLKADLQGIIPAGKKIRLAYIKSAKAGWFGFAMQTTQNTIYVVDSDDGKIRQLYPTGTSTQAIFNVCLTANGEKVVFWNKSSGTMGVVNFDGTGTLTSINAGGVQMTEYWRNTADGSDWGVLLNGNRISVATPRTTVPGNFAGCEASAPTGMSDDGKYLVVQNACDGEFGFFEIASKKYTRTSGGCQPSMRAGSSYQYNINPSGHGAMTVYTLGSTTPVRYETARAATQYVASRGQTATSFSCHGDTPAQEGTRFTQHPDYATFFLSDSKANPILARLSDLKCAYIEDNLASCFFIGDMDAVILPSTGASGVRATAKLNRETARISQETFSLDGRMIRDANLPGDKSDFRGIAISRSSDGLVTKVYR